MIECAKVRILSIQAEVSEKKVKKKSEMLFVDPTAKCPVIPNHGNRINLNKITVQTISPS